MKRVSSTLVAAGALAMAFFGGVAFQCSRAPEGLLAAGEGPVVARFGDHAIGADQARAALASQRLAVRSGGAGSAKEIVQDLARTRVLALRATEKGYDRDPDVVRRHAEQLATLYLEKEVGALPPPSDADVRAYLEAHRAELAQPERVRAAVISFAAASAGDRAAKRAKAAAALKDALARRAEYYAFGELARARSEDPRTAARNGELGELTREELTAAIGPEVAAAAFAMPKPGIHEAVIESASGCHVLKVIARVPAYEPRFEEVRDRLRERLLNERRAERRKAVVDEAWKQADVRIDDDALQKLVSELRAEPSATPPSGTARAR